MFENASNVPKAKPKILTLHMFSAGFIVWLSAVLVACVVFSIHHVVAHNTRRP
jgi:hypothetical protein